MLLDDALRALPLLERYDGALIDVGSGGGSPGIPLAAALPEREVTRGWLKASHRALDPHRSKPWRPWHPLTREAQKKVTPGVIESYAIELMATANLFRRSHRICLEIMSADMPTGVGGATNAEYVPNHIGSSRTTLHKIYRDAQRPSHLLLPVIPQ